MRPNSPALREPLALACAAFMASCAAPAAPATQLGPARGTRAAPPPCAIEGQAIGPVTVTVLAAEPFTVTLLHADVIVRATSDPARVEVAVRAPIRFDAVAEPSQLPLFLTHAAELAAGAVSAPEGTRVHMLGLTERGLRGTVLLGRAEPSARRALALLVGPLDLSCDEVGLRSESATSSDPPRASPGAPFRVVDAPPLRIRPVRIAPTMLEVRPHDRVMPMPAWIVDRRGDEVRVEVRFAEGARVRGWTASAALRPPRPEEAEHVERLTGGGPTPLMELPSLAPRSDVGEARVLRAGSPLFAQPGGADPPWAHSDASVSVRVEQVEGAERARLLALPGVELDAAHAWVELDTGGP